MSKHKHTPGPWIVKFHLPQEGKPMYELKGSGPWMSTSSQLEANASLIAAAPELLEALRKMAGFHQCNDNPDHGYSLHAQQEVEKAWDVIAKAEGRAAAAIAKTEEKNS